MDRKIIDIGLSFDNTYFKLDNKLYSKILPTIPKEPKLVIYNEDLGEYLGIRKIEELAEVFGGKYLPLGAEPIALAYGGHQFGYFNILGDGRANLLGEFINNNEKYDLQLKGSGQTAYSRRGDGKGTLYSMLREYLISEAMNSLGIKTTRTLSVVSTGEMVLREKPYKGGILTRIASSHIRIGTFEFVSFQDDKALLKDFTDYTINRHFPNLNNMTDKYIEFLKEVCQNQINLVIDWIRVGFIHGVMNTDNTSISGETIDFGPCAFINAYNPQKVYSSIDTFGRYAFGNQGKVIVWNLVKFAQSLLPLIHDNEEKAVELAQEIINQSSKSFEEGYFVMLGKKLGLEKLIEGDKELIEEFLNILFINKLDYTNSFLNFMKALEFDESSVEISIRMGWYKKWLKRIENQPKTTTLKLMKENNPKVIPRNHIVEKVLNEASEGKLENFLKVLDVLKKPYEENLSYEALSYPPDNEENYKTYCGT